MFGKSPRHKAMQSIMLCSQEVISFMCGDHMMPILTHFIGITSSIRAQYGIDLPGSLHTNKIPVILGRYPLLGFFCRLSIVPLDMDNGTFNSSHTDVVEKVNLLVPASQHGGTSVAEGSP